MERGRRKGSNMKRTLAAAAIVAMGLGAAPALAQSSGGSNVLKPDLSKIYGKQGSSLQDSRREAIQKLYGRSGSAARLDPRSSLNLGANPSALHRDDAGGAGIETGPDISGYMRLDTDRDGSISREEYLGGKARSYGLPSAQIGNRGPKRQHVYNERLRAQFNRADRNNDGKVSQNELRTLSSPRC